MQAQSDIDLGEQCSPFHDSHQQPSLFLAPASSSAIDVLSHQVLCSALLVSVQLMLTAGLVAGAAALGSAVGLHHHPQVCDALQNRGVGTWAPGRF